MRESRGRIRRMRAVSWGRTPDVPATPGPGPDSRTGDVMTPKPRVGAAVLAAAVAGAVGAASPDGWVRDLATLPEQQAELRQAGPRGSRVSAEAAANLDRME